MRVCECVYHLHGVSEHHPEQVDEVGVVEGVHGVDLSDEVIQSFRQVQYVSL